METKTNEPKRKSIKPLKLLFLTFLIVGTVVILRSNNKETAYQRSEGNIFGTFFHATYQSNENLDKDILAELGKVDNSLSTFNKESIISKINSNEDTTLDSMFVYVFNLAQNISKNTNGSFDITVAPLVNAWGFGFKNKSNVTKQLIDSIQTFVGYSKVALTNGKIVKKDPRTMLDCSAIAKGYGSDAVAKMFDKKGIKNYMIEIGGEIVVKGNNDKGKAWKVGIVKPTDDSLNVKEEIQNIISLTNCGMATSGNYRNFYYKDGKKYAHTIDPKTGYPVQHTILSSTVVSSNCATADAYATSFMVMGLEKTKTLLSKHPELQAYIIYTDQKGKLQTWATSGIKKMIE